MQTEPNAKQQIVERIKNSTNILVTVGRNPSVDALSAALSLTLMLNRLDKHATAVFSGEVPPAIGFLEPAKTFENSVDSLRDFIIALDKEKADRLRYKVENDVVRIFITPYRTVISEKDLKFSQGDFNVELIVALGVEKREDLDAAVTAHGRILHDATVVTINADGGKSTLGTVDWSDGSASSLCEMLMSLSEALQSGLLDQQIATAVLTGIVAATDRFRNEHTSPRVMTMAAQLMAAGANQQLIAAKLEEGHEIPAPSEPEATGDTALQEEGKSEKVAKSPSKKKDDGALEITHEPEADARPLPDPARDALKEAEEELAESLQKTAPVAATLSVDDLQNDLAAAAEEVDAAASVEDVTVPDAAAPQVIKQGRRTWQSEPTDKPNFGSALNATVQEVEAAKVAEEKPILSHGATEPSVVKPPVIETPQEAVAEVPTLDSTSEAQPLPPLPTFEPAEVPTEPKPLESTSDEALSFEPAPIETPSVQGPTLADLDEQTRGKAAEDARAAIDAALSAMPFDPASKPLESAGSAPVFDISHDETPPPPPQPITPEPFTTDTQQAAAPSDLSGMPPLGPDLPPLPDFSTLPPLPGDTPVGPPADQPAFDQNQVPDLPETPAAIPPSAPQSPNDPGQFKIPGQS